MSSMRSRKRPPASRAARHPSQAERAWPRCRYPVGLGANRVTTVLWMLLAGNDLSRAFEHLVPIVDLAVVRVAHYVLPPGRLVGGDALAQLADILACPMRAQR